MRLILSFALLLFTVPASEAFPILWSVNIPMFNNGGVVTGTFVFDADQGPNGTISAINLSSQGGTNFPGPNPFDDMIPVFGTDTAGNGRLFLVADSSRPSLAGEIDIRISWYQYGVLGLTDSGTEVQDVAAFEDVCSSADCYSHYAGPSEYGYYGTFTATVIPEPVTWVTIILGALLFLSIRFLPGTKPN